MERRGFICFLHLYFLIAYRHISYQKIRLITILFRNFASILNLLVFKENKKMTDQANNCSLVIGERIKQELKSKKKVLSCSQSGNTIHMNACSLPKGMYVLNVSSHNKTKQMKIIIK